MQFLAIRDTQGAEGHAVQIALKSNGGMMPVYAVRAEREPTWAAGKQSKNFSNLVAILLEPSYI